MPERHLLDAVARPVTASMLVDLLTCEQRLHLDLHGNPAERGEVGAFVRMLWRNGSQHEDKILAIFADLPGTVDLRETSWNGRRDATTAALDSDAELILGGRIEVSDLLGMPDLLRREPEGWVAGDVKSGSPFKSGSNGGRPKLSYAIQVAHYAHILAVSERGPGRLAFVIGADGELYDYDLVAEQGRGIGNIVDQHATLLAAARIIRDHPGATAPALAAACGLCHWRQYCRSELEDRGDLTLVAELGRAARAGLSSVATTVADLAALDADGCTSPTGKSLVKGIGAARLKRFRDRAISLSAPGSEPYAYTPLNLPPLGPELHFDLETDPLRGGLVYLHGIWERDSRRADHSGKFVHFFAGSHEEERAAFGRAVEYLIQAKGWIVHWSAFERTAYRQLQERYPDVCGREDVERLFDGSRSCDLYSDVVRPHTVWPSSSLGLKSIARLCGFDWRDDDPGGANSMEWFDRWVRTREESLRQRILAYNEDDCRATAAVLDRLRMMPVRETSN